MKRYLVVLFFLCISLSQILADKNVYRINFNIEDLTLTPVTGDDRKEYCRAQLRFNGSLLPNKGQTGAPSMPECSISIAIPEGYSVANVDIIPINKVSISSDLLIYPAQEIYPISETRPGFTSQDKNIYSSMKSINSSIGTYITTERLRGKSIAVISLNPLEFIPGLRSLAMYTSIDVKLNLVKDTHNHKYAKYNKESQIFNDIISSMVINPGEVKRSNSVSEDKRDKIEYLLITTEKLKSEFIPLTEWKTQKGIPAEIITLEWIESTFKGTSTQIRIKNCIKYFAEMKGVEWVTLGGDTDIIPDYDMYNGFISRGTFFDSYYKEPDFPADIFYTGLDDIDWDDDKDGRAGEAWGDSIDIAPDIILGRLPVKTEKDAEVIVRKILKYERNPSLDYGTRFLISGTTLNPDHEDDAEIKSEKMFSEFIDPYWDYAHFRFYNSQTEWGPDYDVSIKNLNTLINSGFNYLHMATHGLGDLWCMEEKYPYYYSKDALMTTNSDKPVNISTIACYSAAIDNKTDPNIAEAFLRNPGGGALSFIGSSRKGWGDYDIDEHGASFMFNDYYYESLFNRDLNKKQKIGLSFNYARTRLLPDYYTEGTSRWIYVSTLLLADPEMPLLTDNPTAIVPMYKKSIKAGKQVFKINTGVENATVCLIKDKEIYATGETGTAKSCSISIEPETVGNMRVTITAPNRLPYTGQVEVTPPYETWKPWVWYHGDYWNHEKADKVIHNGKLYACLQSHTSQPDWEPQDVIDVLWSEYTPPKRSEGVTKLSETVERINTDNQMFFEERTSSKKIDVLSDEVYVYDNNVINYNNKFIFSGRSDKYGIELWISDGTKSGTCLIKDIYKGSKSSVPNEFIIFDDIVYFTARTPKYGEELWRTDGTKPGTYMVKNIEPDDGSEKDSEPRFKVIHDKKLYFIAETTKHGDKIWVTDGTESGTRIALGANDKSSASSPLMKLENNLLYFGKDTTGVKGLLSFNGNKSKLIKKDLIGKGGPTRNYLYEKSGDKVYIRAGYNSMKLNLWVSDGTSTGTLKISNDKPYEIVSGGANAYFSTNSHLWKTDGTTSGTEHLFDLECRNLIFFNNKLVFTGVTDKLGGEVYILNSSESPVLLKDINIVPEKGYAGYFYTVKDKLYFSAEDYIGYELWETDLTESGTTMIRNNQARLFPVVVGISAGKIFVSSNDIDDSFIGILK